MGKPNRRGPPCAVGRNKSKDGFLTSGPPPLHQFTVTAVCLWIFRAGEENGKSEPEKLVRVVTLNPYLARIVCLTLPPKASKCELTFSAQLLGAEQLLCPSYRWARFDAQRLKTSSDSHSKWTEKGREEDEWATGGGGTMGKHFSRQREMEAWSHSYMAPPGSQACRQCHCHGP